MLFFLTLGLRQPLCAQNGVLLDPMSQTKYINELPIPAVMEPISDNYYEVSMTQFKQELGLYDANGDPLETTVWGYNGSYPGPTIEAFRDIDITVRWENNLVDEYGDPLEHRLEIDETVHRADPEEGVPLVTHLHGGHSEWESDGIPDAWFTPNFAEKGDLWRKADYHYHNDQEATTLWYHDHAVGITRLNVYMGLAGFYLLRDEHENSLDLPSGEYEVPLVIQDRSFYQDGELYYPHELSLLEDPLTLPLESEDPTVTVLPEMFGDFILVNGKAWPYLEVEPRKYRLRLLNGSDSRFYDLTLPGVTFYQIGSDGGLLNAPLKMSRLIIGPGERLDVIADFSAPELLGTTLIMKNAARSPYPFGGTPDPKTTGEIMAFKVTKALNPDVPDYIIPASLRPSITALPNQEEVRKLVLFEGTDDYGRLKPLLGTAEEGPLEWTAPITENPQAGAIEDWEIYNTTADAHPIHLHLVHFQVLNTQRFNVKKFVPGDPSSIQLQGKTRPPSSENAGWKDTYIVYPGEVARVRAKFDKEGFYVWHCHILSHEDYDMMRPFYVGDMPDFALEWGQEEPAGIMAAILTTAEIEAQYLNSFEVAPNPMLDNTEIRFSSKEDTQVVVRVYDFMAREVATLFDGRVAANETYTIPFDRQNLVSGTYFAKISLASGQSFERTIIAE